MKKKLTLIMVTTLLFGSIFSINSVAWAFEKQTPSQISLDQVVPFFSTPQQKDSVFCIIQNDNGSPGYYFAKFDSGMGFAEYMNPAKCASQPTYPFKITDVHFQLYAPDATYRWPVAIRVNIRDLSLSDTCAGPQGVLCYEDFSIPSSLAYPDTINLSLSTPCRVNHPFFLEIIYTEKSDTILHPHPSLMMTSTPPPADTCYNWLKYSDMQYSEWYDSWSPPIPGNAIMRATGYTNATGVEDVGGASTPQNFELYQNHPNPFNPVTSIQYTVGNRQRKTVDGSPFMVHGPIPTTLVIYNILGQKVRMLVDEPKRAGSYEAIWDGKDEKGNGLASGVYFYQLKAGEITQTKRLVLLK